MKRTLCLILALLLCLASAGYAEKADTEEMELVISTDQQDDPNQFIKEDNTTNAETGMGQSYGHITGTGSQVWIVTDGKIRCVDIHTQKAVAELPLASLYAGEEDDLLMTSRGNRMTLCAVTGAGSAAFRVTMYELALQDNQIALLNTDDVTDKLGFLFDGKTQWNETSLVTCEGGFLIPALNTEWVYQLYLYDPAGRKISEIGTVPQSLFTGAFARGNNILLIGPSETSYEANSLTQIALPGGETTKIEEIVTGSLSPMSNIALDEAADTLYYFVDSIGYRVKIGSGAEPEPFCVAKEDAAMLRYGVIAEGVYVFLDEEGNLLFQDATGTLKADRIRILDMMGADLLTDTLPAFNLQNPDYLAIAENGEDTETVLNELLNQSTDHDAYVINLGSSLYQALASKGYLGDLSGSTRLMEVSDGFPERILSLIRKDGKLTAFPIGVENSVLLLDTATICNMTGLSREELPTDWTGLLKLLKRIGDEGLMEGSGHNLYESGVSADTFRIMLMTSVLQDALLWLNQDESRLERLPAVLTPAMQALDEIDMQQLGLPEEEDGDGKDAAWMQEGDKPYLMEWTEPEIAVMNIPEGMEYWPLSLAEGEEKLVSQDVSVIVLNPRSAHPEGVIKLMEKMYDEMGDVTLMELDRSENDPVENDTYEEDIEFIKMLIPMYEAAVADAPTEEEAAQLQAELNEIYAFKENYEKNGAWLVSRESIAMYRSLEDLFAIHGDEIWNDDTMSNLFIQYLDRMLDAATFVRQLTSMLQMSRMETK